MASSAEKSKGFSIQGRLYRERERIFNGMTDEERAWRAKWIKDQVLSPCEPLYVPALDKELRNPIRRFYQAPLNLLYKALKPAIGHDNALLIRVIIGRTLLGLAFTYAAAYYFKYNANDWTRKGGWRVVPSRPAVYPGNPGYPMKPDRECPCEYANRGFNKSPI